MLIERTLSVSKDDVILQLQEKSLLLERERIQNEKTQRKEKG